MGRPCSGERITSAVEKSRPQPSLKVQPSPLKWTTFSPPLTPRAEGRFTARRQLRTTSLMEPIGALQRDVVDANPLKDMVGPCGLEPQTSTVSR